MLVGIGNQLVKQRCIINTPFIRIAGGANDYECKVTIFLSYNLWVVLSIFIDGYDFKSNSLRMLRYNVYSKIMNDLQSLIPDYHFQSVSSFSISSQFRQA